MASSITFPDKKTYYILKNGSIHYGFVDVNQVMQSNINSMTIYEIEQDWLDELAVLGISDIGQ